jgi:hypothetical protein
MRLALAPRDRRTLLAGALVMGAIIAAGRGVPAWRAWQRGARDRAAALAIAVDRGESLIRAQRTLRDSLAARDARFLGLAPALLPGESPAGAGATLAGLISAAAVPAGVHLDAVRIDPDSTLSATFTPVAVHVEAGGDVRGLAALLVALERGPALLAIRDLTIAALEPAAPPDRMERLRITLTVEGLMLAPRVRSDSAVRPRGDP